MYILVFIVKLDVEATLFNTLPFYSDRLLRNIALDYSTNMHTLFIVPLIEYLEGSKVPSSIHAKLS